MPKQARKGKPMPWFKCWFFQWDTDEVAALDLETTGFLHLLKLRMAERRSPLPEEFLPHVVRGKRLNKRSIERMLKTLIGYGLIVRENGLIWNEDIAEDIDGFFDVPRKFDQSFAKVSPEQRQKTQQNQCDASTEVEVEVEGDREAPKGASRYHVEKDGLGNREPALANASRFPSAEGREDFTASDPSFDGREGFFAGDPPTADAAASAESVRRMIDLCVERDDDLSMKDSIFVGGLEGRDVSSFTPDDIRRLVNIVNALSEQDFGDDGGGEDIPDENIEAPEASRKPPRWPDDGDATEIDEDGRERPIPVGVDEEWLSGWPDEIDPDAEYDEGGEPIPVGVDEEWLSGWPDDAETANAKEKERAE